MNDHGRPNEVAELPMPAGMSARSVEVGGEEYLILSLPVPSWTVPGYLTQAERSIALAMLRGATNQQIAHERKCSIRTVDNLIARIFAKVGVASRIELAHRLRSVDSCPLSGRPRD